jgi:hypothetical protein
MYKYKNGTTFYLYIVDNVEIKTNDFDSMKTQSLYKHSTTIKFSWIQGNVFFFQDIDNIQYAYTVVPFARLYVNITLSGEKIASIIDGINCLLFVYKTKIV